jgi:hypothetical protein
MKPQSKNQRWKDACATAKADIENLKEIQEEYQETYDNLPENLQNSAYAEKLQAMQDIDFDAALDIIQEAEDADLPLGFGRD